MKGQGREPPGLLPHFIVRLSEAADELDCVTFRLNGSRVWSQTVGLRR